MLFKYIYALLLPISLIFQNVYAIGPFTIGLFVNVLMFCTCSRESYSPPKGLRVKMYLTFLAFFFIVSILYGYGELIAKAFVNIYFGTFVWIWATVILIKKYKAVELLYYPLLAIAIINAIFVVFQHLGMPFSFLIPQILNAAGAEKAESVMEKQGIEGITLAMMGLMGAVKAGYYLAVGAVLSIYLLYKYNSISLLTIWLLIVFGLFFLGERAALISGVAFSSIAIAKYFNSLSVKKRILILFCAAMCVLYYIDLSNFSFTNISEGTRYESFALNEREDIYHKAIDYILDEPFNSNMFIFLDKYNLYPHHIIYNAFIYGTFIGGVIILALLAMYLKEVVRVVKKRLDTRNKIYLIFAIAFLAYNLVSTTHNASLITGDILFWLLVIPVLDYNNKI